MVSVSKEGLDPARLEIHVGEVVRWRAREGGTVRVELDMHEGAHEAIVRQKEIRAVFLEPGEHGYEAAIVGAGGKTFRGLIVVRPALGERRPLLPVCGPGSSWRICVDP